jgi:Ni,Fe-hydrogenase III large subunit
LNLGKKRKKERSKERKKIVYKEREESKVGDEVYQVGIEEKNKIKKKKNRLPEANITQAKHTIQCKLNVDFQELILRILGSRC